jgi:hypothetical protein
MKRLVRTDHIITKDSHYNSHTIEFGLYCFVDIHNQLIPYDNIFNLIPDNVNTYPNIIKYINFIRSLKSLTGGESLIGSSLYKIFNILLEPSQNVLKVIGTDKLDKLDELDELDEPEEILRCRKKMEEDIETICERAKSNSDEEMRKKKEELKFLNYKLDIIEKIDKYKTKKVECAIKLEQNIIKLNKILHNHNREQFTIVSTVETIIKTAEKIINLPKDTFKDMPRATHFLENIKLNYTNYNMYSGKYNRYYKLLKVTETIHPDISSDKKKIKNKIKEINNKIERIPKQYSTTEKSLITQYYNCEEKIKQYEIDKNYDKRYTQIQDNIKKILESPFFNNATFKDATFKDIIHKIMEKLKGSAQIYTIAKCNIKSFMHNFESNKKKQCTLEEYHNITKGEGCQYIGFFDESYNPLIFDYFDKSTNNLIFIDIQQTSITQINDEYGYGVYDKNTNLCLKLNYARYKEDLFKIVNGEAEHQETSKISFEGLPGEHVIINNTDMTINMMNIEYGNNELIKLIFGSKTDLKHFIIRSMLNNVSMFEEKIYRYRNIVVSSKYINNGYVEDGGAMKIKYLKYKQKYMGLKNIIEKFNKL